MTFNPLDQLWIIICVGLVFLMQAGFLCLESGLVRSRHAINVALKNLTDFSLSFLLFWASGFALMFGVSWSGLCGTTGFFVSPETHGSHTLIFFLFQAMFCATAATIVSGAVSGRMTFAGYVITAILVSGVIYPLFGHWAWGPPGTSQGWLARWGFVDFAGSTVVHSIGGWSALAAVMVLGPRRHWTERFNQQTESGSNVPMAMLGVLLLWIGWIGFNGGNTLQFEPRVSAIIVVTFLGGASGMLTGLLYGRLSRGYTDVVLAINGCLAGLVAITGACHALSPGSAVLTGTVGALVMLAVRRLLIQRGIDDAVGAVAVHAGAGTWGTIATALLTDTKVLNTGFTPWQQLLVQTGGAIVASAFSFGCVYTLLRLFSHLLPLRVSADAEQAGLNVSEHGAATETWALISDMETQHNTGDFSQEIQVESGSELAPVALQYNSIIRRLRSETDRALALADEARHQKQQAEQIQQELQTTVADLQEFNDLAAGRELRMVELKDEVNQLLAEQGNDARYEVCDEPV